MCEYCGCQSVPAIHELTMEHDAVVNLIGEVTRRFRASDTAAAVDACRRISLILSSHTAVEELGLFPAMAGEFPEQVRLLRREHRVIEAVLVECADEVPTDPGWPDRVVQSLDLLREHILKEQDGVFPATLSVLDNEDWVRIDDIRARVGSGLSPTS